jgi:hypothetical protein
MRVLRSLFVKPRNQSAAPLATTVCGAWSLELERNFLSAAKFISPVGSATGQDPRAVPIGRTERNRTMRGFLIGALLVAVGVLGYLYWEETRNEVSIKLEPPKVELPKSN